MGRSFLSADSWCSYPRDSRHLRRPSGHDAHSSHGARIELISVGQSFDGGRLFWHGLGNLCGHDDGGAEWHRYSHRSACRHQVIGAEEILGGAPPGRTTTLPSGRFLAANWTWSLGGVCPKRPVSFLQSGRPAKPSFCAMEFYKAAVADLTLPAKCRQSLAILIAVTQHGVVCELEFSLCTVRETFQWAQ